MDRLKVMVVDDESRMRKLVRDFLEKQDYQVIEAADGEEAVDKFFSDKEIALILLDVMMPKMDGWQVVREIRQFSKVPIIMLTARGDERDELLGFNLWLLDFGRNESKKIKPVLPKQYSVQELEEYATELALQIEHWVNGGEDLDVKLRDYLDGATVLFDASGNVADGRLQGDYSPWVISPRGVEVSFTWSDLSNKKFVGVCFTQDTSREILDLLTRLYKAGKITSKSPHGRNDEEDE